MTQLPYGAPDEGEESQRGYPPQQYNQYPPYGQEHGQYQSPPPVGGYGPPHGGNQQYYAQGQDNWNRGPEEYQQPHPQQNYPGPHTYGNNYNSSYGSPPPGAPYGSPPPPPSVGAPYGSPPPQAGAPYGSSPHPSASAYGAPPPAPRYGSFGDQDRFGGSEQYAPPQGPPPGHQGYAPPPGPPPPNAQEADRGLLGALAGGAAGGYAGHQVHHGLIGALGGAYAGHKLEDHFKEEKKRKKAEKKAQAAAMGVPYRRGSSSSSSSSSSDDERKKLKKKPQQQQQQQFRGNFSASSAQISLDKDYDLIASCAAMSGHQKLSSISLNDVLTNENGHFKWVLHGGNFGGSARNVRLENGGRVLVAELGTMDGRWREDYVWLDERIENSDGDLRFT